MNKFTCFIFLGFALTMASCQQKRNNNAPVIGFVEAFEDATIAEARKGFIDALAERGFAEKDSTLNVIYKNAQGDIPTLNQIINYFVSEKVDLIGSSTTLAAISSVQRNKDIPVFISVSSMPDLIGLLDAKGNPPKNLFGAGEELNYIDTSFAIIPQVIGEKVKDRKIRVGMIYNQAEPQSVDAYKRITGIANRMGVELIALPLNNSSEAQLVTRLLLEKQIDAFFANPDNTVFAAFETIYKNCFDQGVPIFTSESGLVERGAVAAFGADIYLWGHQAGMQAADFLEQKSTDKLKLELVKVRKRVYNPISAAKFNFTFPEGFEAVGSQFEQ